MTNEEFYDKELAPVLMKMAKQCKRRKMSFLCCVEYDPKNHGIGRTEVLMPDEKNKLSASQRLIHWAARCAGNIDKLFMACDRHGKEHGHSSIYLSMLGNKNVKYSDNEYAAIAVVGPK